MCLPDAVKRRTPRLCDVVVWGLAWVSACIVLAAPTEDFATIPETASEAPSRYFDCEREALARRRSTEPAHWVVDVRDEAVEPRGAEITLGFPGSRHSRWEVWRRRDGCQRSEMSLLDESDMTTSVNRHIVLINAKEHLHYTPPNWVPGLPQCTLAERGNPLEMVFGSRFLLEFCKLGFVPVRADLLAQFPWDSSVGGGLRSSAELAEIEGPGGKLLTVRYDTPHKASPFSGEFHLDPHRDFAPVWHDSTEKILSGFRRTAVRVELQEHANPHVWLPVRATMECWLNDALVARETVEVLEVDFDEPGLEVFTIEAVVLPVGTVVERSYDNPPVSYTWDGEELVENPRDWQAPDTKEHRRSRITWIILSCVLSLIAAGALWRALGKRS